MSTATLKSRVPGAARRPDTTGPIASPWTHERGQISEARERKRESVLQAAAMAFVRRGVDGTSMDDLAASLGVTKPTIYRTVGGKDALVRACEDRMNQRFRDALVEARRMPGNGLQKIEHYLRSSLHLIVGDTFGRLILALGSTDMYSNTSQDTRDMREKAEAQFRTWLRADIRAGVVRADVDPKWAALALFATFNFIPRWYRPDGAVTLDELFDANFRIFVHGLGAGTRPVRRAAVRRHRPGRA